MTTRRPLIVLLAAGALLGLGVWLVYRTGLGGPLVFDDYPSIIDNPDVHVTRLGLEPLLAAALSYGHGLFSRPLSMLSIGLDFWRGGGAVDAFKSTNLLIHLVNALLVLALARTLCRARARPSPGPPASITVPVLAAALWALHPVQLTGVLYVVQRMTSLSAACCFAGTLLYARGRMRLDDDRAGARSMMIAGVAGGGALGFLFKENAVLLPGLLLVVELAFFDRRSLDEVSRRFLRRYFALALGLPLAAVIAYVVAHPGFIASTYAARGFDWVERLLTEARVLFFYLGLVFFPVLSRFSLYHDDFGLSTDLLHPWTTLPAVCGWLIVLAVLPRALLRRRPWAFGLAWYLAGHALESTFLGLELVHEHRNYLPSFGLAFASAWYLDAALERLALRAGLRVVLLGCIVGVLAYVTHVRASIWSNRVTLYELMVRHHPHSYRANNALGMARLEAGAPLASAYAAFARAAADDDRTLFPLTRMALIVQTWRAASPPACCACRHPGEASRAFLARAPAITGACLDQIAAAIDAEVTRRLRTRPINLETLWALRTLQTCTLARSPPCVGLLEHQIRWHRTALAAMPERGDLTATVVLSLAKLEAFAGDVDAARALTARAVSVSTDKSYFETERALFLIAAGDLDGARRIAESLHGDSPLQRLYAQVRRRALLDRIEKARAGKR